MNGDNQACSVIILAAGLGTRMKSSRVKVLHSLLGRPMVSFPITLARKLGADRVVLVVGHQAEDVKQTLQGTDVEFVLQAEQLGTGHAVQQAVPKLADVEGPIVILCGDVPLLRLQTIRELLTHHGETEAVVTVLTTRLKSAAGYGRIVRTPSDNIVKIVEDKDASEEERKIREINTGIYCFDAEFLRSSIHSLTNRNVQKEYYLTDLIEVAQLEQQRVSGLKCADPGEVMGINTRGHLARAEAILRDRVNLAHMEAGVTMIDPARTYIGMDVDIGEDTVLYPDCHLEGTTQIGKECTIGPDTRIVDCEIADRVEIKGYSVLTESKCDEGVILGPFAHLRPGAHIAGSAKIGNFVEIKNSFIGPGSKVSHLSYVGDTELGRGVNIGAGTIVCNYDGVQKHRTVIGDEVFVGSDTQFVAPVKIGNRALVGAGSTITRDVPEDALAISRAQQKNFPDGAKKIRARLKKNPKK